MPGGSHCRSESKDNELPAALAKTWSGAMTGWGTRAVVSKGDQTCPENWDSETRFRRKPPAEPNPISRKNKGYPNVPQKWGHRYLVNNLVSHLPKIFSNSEIVWNMHCCLSVLFAPSWLWVTGKKKCGCEDELRTPKFNLGATRRSVVSWHPRAIGSGDPKRYLCSKPFHFPAGQETVCGMATCAPS